MTTDAAPAVHTRESASLLRRAWAKTRPFRPVLAVVIVLSIVLSIWQPGFRTWLNVQNLLTSVSLLWIVSMAMTFVLVSGGFDLSVGATAALCGIALAKLLNAGVPGVPALLLTILFGAAVGAVLNGIFIGRLGLSVFVVTLASMTALSGVVLVWTQTQSIYVSAAIVNQISINSLLGIQSPIWIMAAVFVIFLFLQTKTYFGRDLYATGGSMTAARLSGIRTSRTLIIVYAMTGACAALAGSIGVGRVGAATPSVDATIALQAIAAVLLGGTSLVGGYGGVGGTVFGVLFIGILQNGLNIAGVASSWQYIVTGAILLLAVLGDRIGHFEGGLATRLRSALHLASKPAERPRATPDSAVECVGVPAGEDIPTNEESSIE